MCNIFFESLKNFSEKLGKTIEPKEQKKVLEELHNFFGFWMRIHELMLKHKVEYEKSNDELKKLLEIVQNLLSDVVTSMKGKDYVLAADIFEYELIPAIETIEDVIPKLNQVLKQWKTKAA